jgi:hypothetical protein
VIEWDQMALESASSSVSISKSRIGKRAGIVRKILLMRAGNPRLGFNPVVAVRPKVPRAFGAALGKVADCSYYPRAYRDAGASSGAVDHARSEAPELR